MNFVLMHQTIVARDAIGRDIVEMYNLLNRRHNCYLYGDYILDFRDARRLDRSDLDMLLGRPSTAIIYHHSNYWEEGEAFLERAVGPIIFKYHNITPPRCFAFDHGYWYACLRGREQTLRFFHKFPNAYWLTDSAFNLEELGLSVDGRSAVLPPFPSMTQGAEIQPDGPLLRRLIESQDLNLLFSGRFAPNKGHELMVRVVQEYAGRYGRNIRLYIVGKLEPACQPYYDRVQALIAGAGLQDHVLYLGTILDEELLAYYLGCDAYLCCSDHEGFCVPIVEAQYCHLPVVAKAKGAVPETLGPSELLFGESPSAYADALHRLRTDEVFRHQIIRTGYANYASRFTYPCIEAGFREAIHTTSQAEL